MAPHDSENGLKFLEDLTTNTHQIQQQLLEGILQKAAHSDYLKGFLNGQCDKDLFRNKVPIVKYEDLKPYIERIANGDPSIQLSAEAITQFLRSSGTSGGQPKLIPSSSEDLDRCQLFHDLGLSVMRKYFDGLDHGKGMYILLVRPEMKTPSGLMSTSLLTSYFKSSNFRIQSDFRTSPVETIFYSDSKQSMYCQLLCGLVQRDKVVRVGAYFAVILVRSIKFLED